LLPEHVLCLLENTAHHSLKSLNHDGPTVKTQNAHVS
jgi:hypothetical protein